jgi:hypothetical protein
MSKKKKPTRDEKVFKARLDKQLDRYGYYAGTFLPGTELTEGLPDDPKIETVIKQVLRAHTRSSPDPTVVKIIKKQVRKAEAGDRKAAEFLFDRAYGKPQQTVHVDTPAPVTINHMVISIEEAKVMRGDG